MEIIPGSQIDLADEFYDEEISSCFNFGGPVKVKIRHFVDFHKAFACLNELSLMEVGIIHSSR